MSRSPCPVCGHDFTKDLSEAEQAVMDLLAEGLSTKQIASKRWTSPLTVRNQVEKIMWKLDVHTRIQAILEWQKRKES